MVSFRKHPRHKRKFKAPKRKLCSVCVMYFTSNEKNIVYFCLKHSDHFKSIHFLYKTWMPWMFKKFMILTKTYLKNLIYQVTGSAIEVHKYLGPGLLESVYHTCMKQELARRRIQYQSEVTVPICFKGLDLATPLKCDLLIEKVLPVELKAVEQIHPLHEAQILSYMRLLEAPQGLLINFNVTNIYKEGQRSYVNDHYRLLSD